MQNVSSLITSKAGLVSILTGAVWLLTNILPVIPANPWGNLITAVVGIFAFYHIGNTVTAGRAGKLK